MQASQIPTKFSIPFANSAGSGYIRTVPTASQIGVTNGAASLTDGFPPLNSMPVDSGGVPPFMQDTNGILNAMSAWTRWQNAGGPIAYDASFQSSIGGYPLGALVASGTTQGVFWLSTVDNNTTDPDTGGAGWKQPFEPYLGFTPVQQGGGIGQAANKIYLGWDGTNRLKATVNTTDLGFVVFDSDLQLALGQTQSFGAGTYTWTCPAGEGYLIVKGRMWGGGGGGGGTVGSGSGASGGGGGQYGEFSFPASRGASYSVTAGGPGTGGSGANNGTSGGSSLFSGPGVPAPEYSVGGGQFGYAGNGAVQQTYVGAGGSGGQNCNFSQGGEAGSIATEINSVTILCGSGGWAVGSNQTPFQINSVGSGGYPLGGGGAGGAQGNAGGNGAGGVVILDY